MSMHKSYKLHISGKVQGVWYRASAKDKAISLGLTGKVWNEKDGSVGVIVQGPVNKILEFIEWCKKGPPLSRVENVTHEVLADDGDHFEGFDIVRG